MKGADILIDGLINEGVDTIFGYPGGVVIPIFDVLYTCKGIKTYLTRHEQGATHAADGYARATGKVGVCLVTSGPGATNTITGIANAKMDSVPIVVISGQVPSGNIGTDAFQETDMVGLTRSVCKHNYLVTDVRELGQVIKEAFHIARTGRPGPVTVDISVDVLNSLVHDYKYPEEVQLPGYKPTTKANPRQLKKLAHEIKKAKRPLVYAGGGIVLSGASDELVQFVEKTNIPAVITMMGLGAMSFDHPLFVGMPGMHGVIPANFALAECDLMIAIGSRFDDRITGPRHQFGKNATIVHVDIDPAEINKNVNADIPVIGDAKDVLTELLEIVEERKPNDWNKKVDDWKKQYPLAYNKESKEILPQMVIDKVAEMIDDNTIVATDVGQHQMWAAQFITHKKPRKFVTSGGLGTMGFGLPAAMGAAVGCKDCQTICISGDGSFQMNIQELATCALNKIPVKVIVSNNNYLGMVRQWQELFWDKRYSSTCLRRTADCPPICNGPNKNCPNRYLPDFVKVAEANGVKGLRAETPEEIEAVLKEGLAAEGPVVMEFIVKEEENVYPMIPAGKPINHILTGDES